MCRRERGDNEHLGETGQSCAPDIDIAAFCKLMFLKIHTKVIDLHGADVAAAAMATALHAVVEPDLVIYVNAASHPKDGVGPWWQVKESWFLHHKFGKATEIRPSGAAVQRIDAEAHCQDRLVVV